MGFGVFRFLFCIRTNAFARPSLILTRAGMYRTLVTALGRICVSVEGVPPPADVDVQEVCIAVIEKIKPTPVVQTFSYGKYDLVISLISMGGLGVLS